MKTRIALTILMIAAASTGRAQTGKYAYYEAAMKNYTWNFEYGNEGVVTSSLYTILRFRLLNDSGDFSPIVQQLYELSRKSDNTHIAYKAYLTAYALEQPSVLQSIFTENSENEDVYFYRISNKIRDMHLMIADNK